MANDIPAPVSERDALARDTYSRQRNPFSAGVQGDWLIASEWRAGASASAPGEHWDFKVVADLEKVLRKHGDGIYTVFVWAKLNGEPTVISEVVLFHDIPQPVGIVRP